VEGPRIPRTLIFLLAAGIYLPPLAEPAAGLRLSRDPVLAVHVTLGALVLHWVRRDMRATRYNPCFHYKDLMFGMWFFLLPHYLARTRGRAGLRWALVLYAPFLFLAGLLLVLLIIIALVGDVS
jgi:hypothetical protein